MNSVLRFRHVLQVNHIKDYWTESLSLPPSVADVASTEYELLVLFDMGNAVTKYRIVRNEIYRAMKTPRDMSLCPELFSQLIYLEPLKFILSVLFLTCPVTEFANMLRPLLSSPLATNHLTNLVRTTPQLLEDILECSLEYYSDCTEVSNRRCERLLTSLAAISSRAARTTRAVLAQHAIYPSLCIQLSINEDDFDEYIDEILGEADKICGNWLVSAMTFPQVSALAVQFICKLQIPETTQDSIRRIIRVLSVIISVHQSCPFNIVADVCTALQFKVCASEQLNPFRMRMAFSLLLVRLSVVTATCDVEYMFDSVESLMREMFSISELQTYVFFVSISFNQNRMVALRSLISRDLQLDHIGDFLSPQQLVTLMRLVAETTTMKKWINNDTICSHFVNLSRPSFLDAESETAGDWLWCLGLLLRCNCFTSWKGTGGMSSEAFLREVMLHVVSVSKGWHSWLQEIIETWLNFCIVRSDKFLRTVMCFMPHDVKNMTKELVDDATGDVSFLPHLWEYYGLSSQHVEQCDTDIVDFILSRRVAEIPNVNYSAIITCYIVVRFNALLSERREVYSTASFTIDIRELPLRRAVYQMAFSSHTLKRGSDILLAMVSSLRAVVPEYFLPERQSSFWMSNSTCAVSSLSRSDIRQLVEDTLKIPNRDLDACLPLLSVHPKDLTYATVVLLERCIPQIVATGNVALSDYVFNIWRMVHGICISPDALELATINTLLDMAHTCRPRVVPSYSLLIQEPLLLFRLPRSMLQCSGILKVIIFICRSLVAASRKRAITTLQSRRRLFHKQSLYPAGGSNVCDTTQKLNDVQYLLYQDVLIAKALVELWAHIDASFRGRENLLAPIRTTISTYLNEMCCANDDVVQILAFYGMNQSAFELLASLDPLLWKLSLAVSQAFLVSVDCGQLNIIEAALMNTLNLLRVAAHHVITRQFVFSLPTTFKKLVNLPYFKHSPNTNDLGSLCIELCDVLAEHYVGVVWQLIDVFDSDNSQKSVLETLRKHTKHLQVQKVKDEHSIMVAVIRNCEQDRCSIGNSADDNAIAPTCSDHVLGVKRKRSHDDEVVA